MTEAENTVMSENEIKALLRGMPFNPVKEVGWLNFVKRCLDAQDKISFKAGMGKMAEWLEDNGDIEVDYTDDMHLKKCELTIPWHKLQAFLKEWGIEQNEGERE